jgi:hypothetical protein
MPTTYRFVLLLWGGKCTYCTVRSSLRSKPWLWPWKKHITIPRFHVTLSKELVAFPYWFVPCLERLVRSPLKRLHLFIDWKLFVWCISNRTFQYHSYSCSPPAAVEFALHCLSGVCFLFITCAVVISAYSIMHNIIITRIRLRSTVVIITSPDLPRSNPYPNPTNDQQTRRNWIYQCYNCVYCDHTINSCTDITMDASMLSCRCIVGWLLFGMVPLSRRTSYSVKTDPELADTLKNQLEVWLQIGGYTKSSRNVAM